MAETDDDFAADAPLVRRERWRPSLVWLVPIVALVAAVVLAARTWLAAGPQITISFRTAEGLEAGRTEVRFKEVVVGRVGTVELSRDRQTVLVTVNLDRGAADLAVDDSRFWVVRPRVGFSGVTGLGTILSGAYIGVDAGVSDEPRRRFVGLEAPPFFLRGEPGRVFVLDAQDLGSLDLGSPVYYRRTRVGRVVGYSLDPVRDALAVQVFVEAPNERLVTTASRWWNASGVELRVDASGLALNTESLTSLLAGGIAFANPTDTPLAAAASDGHRFVLHRDRTAALAPADGEPLRLRMVFDRAPLGLAVDAPVQLLGVEVGRVSAIAVQYDAARRAFQADVRAEVHPARLGVAREQLLRDEAAAPNADARFVKRLVEAGLRAQVRTGNLLTGQLYVALELVPGVRRVSIDDGAEPLTVPTVPALFANAQQQLAEIVDRISRVPFDRIGGELQATLTAARGAAEQLQGTLARADATIATLTPDAQQALADLRRTLAAAQAAMSNVERNWTQSDAPLQRNATAALAELQRAARALRVLGEYLQQHPESLLRGKPADRAQEAPR